MWEYPIDAKASNKSQCDKLLYVFKAKLLHCKFGMALICFIVKSILPRAYDPVQYSHPA